MTTQFIGSDKRFDQLKKWKKGVSPIKKSKLNNLSFKFPAEAVEPEWLGQGKWYFISYMVTTYNVWDWKPTIIQPVMERESINMAFALSGFTCHCWQRDRALSPDTLGYLLHKEWPSSMFCWGQLFCHQLIGLNRSLNLTKTTPTPRESLLYALTNSDLNQMILSWAELVHSIFPPTS